MKDPKYLSNKELVEEFYNNKDKTLEDLFRKNKLKKEILKRLEEPWRKIIKD